MTRSSDLVMVEREVLERAHGHLCKIAGTETWTHNNLDGWQVTPGALREYAESAAKELDRALQSVEGGFQVAAKQESCPESAPRTETAVRDWQKSAFTYEHDDVAGHLYYFAPQVTAPGPFLEQHHVQAIVDIASDGTFAGVELIDNMPPLAATSTQLTKTPSADHDAGNLRGLAEPNHHQPHALSQGWRDDMENAPGGVRLLIAGRYPNGIWYVEESYRHYAGHFNGRKIDPPTHWMPLPAPPVPETTPRDSSESTTGGAE